MGYTGMKKKIIFVVDKEGNINIENAEEQKPVSVSNLIGHWKPLNRTWIVNPKGQITTK